jgi:hypothetical protein
MPDARVEPAQTGEPPRLAVPGGFDRSANDSQLKAREQLTSGRLRESLPRSGFTHAAALRCGLRSAVLLNLKSKLDAQPLAGATVRSRWREVILCW